MVKGLVHSIESMGLVDGPGIRTIVFLQGCNLRCKYCHNPDTWALNSKKASLMSPQEVVNILKRFKPYYGQEGGVTFSGGEPLLQKDFLLEVLPLCKEAGIHVCLDTAGNGCGDYEKILQYTDLVLLDVKHETEEGFLKITGKSDVEAKRFLEAARRSKTPLWIRHVVVPGLTDSEEHFKKLQEYLLTLENVERIELLPYHTLGVEKYHSMKINYPLEGVPPMDEARVKEWQKRLNEAVIG